MRRKIIFWIVVAVLAAAALAAVGIVAYHVGFNHGAGRSVVAGPLRRFGFVTPGVGVGRTAGFSAATSLLLLLIGGAVGAAIGYLAWGGRAAGAAAVQPAFVATTPQPPMAAGAPVNPLWQQFDEWHRSVHAAAPAPEAPTAVTPAAPPVATSASPDAPVAPEPRPAGSPEPPEPPAPSGAD